MYCELVRWIQPVIIHADRLFSHTGEGAFLWKTRHAA